MNFLWKLIKLSFLFCIVVCGFLFWQAYTFLNTAPSKLGKEVIFEVSQGSTFNHVANDLEKKGLITDSYKFGILARLKGLDSKLHAGRFILNSGWTPNQTLLYLIEGKTLLHRITIREGLTWWETARLLEDKGFVRFEDFEAVIKDTNFLRKYGIPFKNAEGFLMPDTYLLEKDENPSLQSAQVIASRLVDTFWQKMKPHWKENKPPSIEDLKRIVILASIVERETGVPSERARVAGVYANRLRIKMPLQADPTIIYGLGPDFDNNLRRVHLNDAKNPYNTYKHRGLTPGPICSPGVAAMQAAITPEVHKFLYFVAITDGGQHKFSKNLQEHNIAVRQYLNNRRKNK